MNFYSVMLGGEGEYDSIDSDVVEQLQISEEKGLNIF